MDKLKLETADLSEKNIERIAKLFPGVITEIRGDDGKPKKGINFELLRQELSGDVSDDGGECYAFTWVGKKAAIAESNRPVRKTLRPCVEESRGWETTGNLYIEGDNLDVLKLLQESYLNQVKMIYIDPPYNTGNDFIYKDSFAMDKDTFEEQIGLYDEDENRLFPNPESNGRFHSDWCSMIYPRLRLAYHLLSDDGVIFVSIDDRELDNLKKICNEIFGDCNFVGNIVWQTATDNNPSQISVEHEYILCYAKSKASQDKWVVTSDKAMKIDRKYQELKAKYKEDILSIQKELKDWISSNGSELKGASHYCYVDQKGVYYPGNSSNTRPGGYTFDIIHPVTGRVCKKPDYGYRWTEATFLEAAGKGDVEWGEDETTVPKIKKRIETVTEMLKSYYYEDNRYWSKYLNSLMGARVFENPKSVTLLMRLLKFATKKDSIVMDFFSGSATTAHAVMQLNASDGGNRRFIMVQLPELSVKDSEAYRAGYRNICEIGKERIRRAGGKIRDEVLLENARLKAGEQKKVPDIGFRVLKLDSTNMKDVYYSADEYDQRMLDALEINIKEDRTDLDLLYGVLLDWGMPLSSKHQIETIGGVRVHTVDDGGGLIACFADKVSETVIREIAKRRPGRAVFRDSSFMGSPDKINVEEIFKLLAPRTGVRVI